MTSAPKNIKGSGGVGRIFSPPPTKLIYIAQDVFCKPLNMPKNNAIKRLIGNPKALMLK